MKRSALKRRTPMARGTATLDRSTPLQSGKRKTRKKIAPATLREVAQHCRGRCIRCRSKAALQRHHVLPVREFPEHQTAAWNIVLACAGCHDEHERWHRRFLMAELPASVITGCRSAGGREALWLERNYPR